MTDMEMVEWMEEQAFGRDLPSSEPGRDQRLDEQTEIEAVLARRTVNLLDSLEIIRDLLDAYYDLQRMSALIVGYDSVDRPFVDINEIAEKWCDERPWVAEYVPWNRNQE